MKKSMKLGAIALTSALALSVVVVATPSATAATCKKKTEVVMFGTIKDEIKDQFLAAVSSYNRSQSCYNLKSIVGDKKLTFLQNIAPKYAAKDAPTIMYDLQFIPDMADKVMDLKNTKLAKLTSPQLLAAGKVGNKQVGLPSTAEAFGLVYNKSVIKEAGVDTLVLGCTHYPLLTGALSYVMGENVTLVSSAEETAKDLYRTLVETDQLRSATAGPAEHRFLATGDAKSFAVLARRFLGPEVQNVEQIQ